MSHDMGVSERLVLFPVSVPQESRRRRIVIWRKLRCNLAGERPARLGPSIVPVWLRASVVVLLCIGK